MTTTTWKTLFGAIGVAVAIVLAQTDVPLDPIVKLTLVVIAGVLAFINPDRSA